MKTLVRTTSINALALFFLPQIIPGVKITGGFITFILGGLIFSLMSYLLKPLLNLFALPFNLVTLGAFSFLIHVFILYLLTVFITQISISPFIFEGFSFIGFVIPRLSFNGFFAYVVSSLVLSLIITFLQWLIEK